MRFEIVDFSGKLLARYARHLRVEREFWDARLGLDRSELRPGEQLLIRVENYGTEVIAYGEEFSVQAYRGGRWKRVPFGSGWLAWLGYVEAGATGRCNALTLHRSFPPGKYWIVKEVKEGSWAKGKRAYRLTAPFEVIGTELRQ